MSNQTPLYSALVQHHRLGRSAFSYAGGIQESRFLN